MRNDKNILIISYKHNKQVHRTWYQTELIKEDEDCFIIRSTCSLVIENDGRRWYANEPAISVFFKKKWMNVVCMLRKNGINYYCNIASPSVLDGKSIKYIDYDMDVKVTGEGIVKVLDIAEYHRHKSQMKYGYKLDKILNHCLSDVLEMIRKKVFPFDPKVIYDLYAENKEN